MAKRSIWGVRVYDGDRCVGTLVVDGEEGPGGKPAARGFATRELAEEFIEEHCPPGQRAVPFEQEIDDGQVIATSVLSDDMSTELAVVRHARVH